jgi:2-dehydropantoate 2-reductase
MEETKIKTVAIIGLGALGIMYAHHLSKHMPKENLRIIADEERIKRYREEKVFCNGEVCEFNYITPREQGEPADLVLFTVKYQGLEAAIRAVKNQIGEQTIILSALNGITSEEIIAEEYGKDKLLYCVAQGMDAVKEGNRLSFEHMGLLVFGEQLGVIKSDKLEAVTAFFDEVMLPYQVDPDMRRRMWGKFMLNVGVNQTVAVIEGSYGDIQKEGPAREKMIVAMREVLLLSEKEGIFLTEEDLNYWLMVLATLNPEGKPSMRQDLEAKRYSELELFAGTVLSLAKKHGIDTPVNRELYAAIKRIEGGYDNPKGK